MYDSHDKRQKMQELVLTTGPAISRTVDAVDTPAHQGLKSQTVNSATVSPTDPAGVKLFRTKRRYFKITLGE